jgi:single-strand DNA-binding protein
MNQTILIGRLTKDPEMRYTTNGTAVTTFTLAVDRNNDKKETDFIAIVTWSKTAENVANYCTKGKLVAVSGRIQTRNYEKGDGSKVYVTEIVANEVKFLEPKSSGQAPTEPPAPAPMTSGSSLLEGSTTSFDADDLPFHS